MKDPGDIELYDVIQICKAYNDLGWAIQEQLDDVLDGRGEEANPNALDYILRFLDKVQDSGILVDSETQAIHTILDERGIQ